MSQYSSSLYILTWSTSCITCHYSPGWQYLQVILSWISSLKSRLQSHQAQPPPNLHAAKLIVIQIIGYFDTSGGLLFHKMCVARQQQSQVIITMVSICRKSITVMSSCQGKCDWCWQVWSQWKDSISSVSLLDYIPYSNQWLPSSAMHICSTRGNELTHWGCHKMAATFQMTF